MQRIQKLIAQSGHTSRRKAEELIKAGKVKVNGKEAVLGQKASWKDLIEINNKKLKPREELVYYVLNKPMKTITSLADEKDRQTVIDFIDEKRRIFPVGRLDWNTTGVLLLTNDGDLAYKLTHPSFRVKRVYEAEVDHDFTKEELDFLNGDKVIINEKPSKQEVVKVTDKKYMISLHLGTYHHVKNLFLLVENEVINLNRIKYAGIEVKDLELGEYRTLKTKELKDLKSINK